MNGPTPTEPGVGRSADAPTLARRVEESLDSHGTGLPLAVVSRVVSEVAAELDRMHEAGRTHGDVQPSWILVPPRGPVRLRGTDLNAPFSAVSVGGDVAGLAAAAYFALCGVAPSYFHSLSSLGDTASGRPASSVLVSPGLHRPDLPAAVSDVLLKGLSPQAESRYATAGGFAAALREAVGASAAPPVPAAVSPKRRLVPLAALIACGAVFAGVWLGGHRHPERRAPDPAPVIAPGTVRPSSPAALPSSPNPAVLPAAAALPLKQAGRLPAPARAASKSLPAAAAPPAPIPSPAMGAASRPAGVDRVDQKHLQATSRPIPPSTRCSLRVYARQFLTAHDVLVHHVSPVRALRVLVDGKPSRSLASGQWTSLPPGKHKLAFYPIAGVPFDPNTKFWVVLGPHRRAYQIPLPRHPGGVQGALPKKRASNPV